MLKLWKSKMEAEAPPTSHFLRLPPELKHMIIKEAVGARDTLRPLQFGKNRFNVAIAARETFEDFKEALRSFKVLEFDSFAEVVQYSRLRWKNHCGPIDDKIETIIINIRVDDRRRWSAWLNPREIAKLAQSLCHYAALRKVEIRNEANWAEGEEVPMLPYRLLELLRATVNTWPRRISEIVVTEPGLDDSLFEESIKLTVRTYEQLFRYQCMVDHLLYLDSFNELIEVQRQLQQLHIHPAGGDTLISQDGRCFEDLCASRRRLELEVHQQYQDNSFSRKAQGLPLR